MEEKLNNNENNNKVKDSLDINLLKKEIELKNELIEKLQNENKELIKKNEENISLLNREIITLKETKEKEVNLLKEYFDKQLNLLKEEFSKNNNNKNEIKEEKEDKQILKDIKIIKEDIQDLTEKYNNFERIFENKLDFIESTLSKLMDKEENDKNDSKDFENKLLKIFDEKNDDKEHIDKDDLDELKKISINIIENDGLSPLTKTRNIFDNTLNRRIKDIDNKNTIINLANKKNELFEFLDKLEFELNFIIDLRKEFNLSKEEFPYKFLLIKSKENNWDKKKIFNAIIFKD